MTGGGRFWLKRVSLTEMLSGYAKLQYNEYKEFMILLEFMFVWSVLLGKVK